MSPQPQTAAGAPLSRVDGKLKVTGRAKYAADHEIPGVVHAVVVDSGRGRGRIDSTAHSDVPVPLKLLDLAAVHGNSLSNARIPVIRYIRTPIGLAVPPWR